MTWVAFFLIRHNIYDSDTLIWNFSKSVIIMLEPNNKKNYVFLMQFRNVSRRRFLIFSLRWVFYTPLPQPQFTVNSMYECSSMIPFSGNVVILTKTKDHSMWTKWAKERGQWKLLVEGVTETRVSGTCSTVEKYGLKASRTRLFITFCQIFVIFDVFSKFHSEKSSNMEINGEKSLV